ncbi:MAG: exosortase-associated EpsI family protein [Planctomycetota bacterium]
MPKHPIRWRAWGVYAAAAGLLILSGWAQSTRERAQGAEDFHQRVRVAIQATPRALGAWTGRDEDLPPEAIRLLRPTATTSRIYTRSDRPSFAPQLLIVHCQDARDLRGHYPPNCYPSAGYEAAGEERVTWTVNGQAVPGKRYRFRRAGSSFTVAHFFVVPGLGPQAEMTEVFNRASEPRLRRFGAGQAQVLIEGRHTDEQRLQVETELFQGVAGWIEEASRIEDAAPVEPIPAPADTPAESTAAAASADA